ncbi:SRPBCC domain-containing protein [Aeromonas caviae]|uniref:SRPBCC domain-containing protein n=2 Tax=Aeromonadaceae TaxID=84642 RepID=A0AAW9F2V0_AERCA|nr:SRPBCC domain-containing protein [Aeromonas caviae]MDX7598236.1 SRPBCC domain-containing protein [Aeromonas caviae]MDX7722379.1 SRPBCC domain-containing protein [Aeromonas caviae]MDX7775981.1 SRPBCC domain-containing protein [Aeromonas caviae]MDX7866057.1 SRPBCC domain-containing protein [Aeromonas caviae]
MPMPWWPTFWRSPMRPAWHDSATVQNVQESQRIREMKISVSVWVARPIADVWQGWNTPASIMAWNAASPQWHCPQSRVDLRVGGWAFLPPHGGAGWQHGV